jgi:hypothetical protein
MARSRRLMALCVPLLLSGLCAASAGCQCSINCTPTFKGPNCGPSGCGGGNGYGCGGGCANPPAGAGQWAQQNHDASHQPGQWGQGCNSPPMGGYGPPPVYPTAYQGGYQGPPMQQQQQPNIQLGPTPVPDRAPDRMPNVQGNNNMNVPYSGTLTNGSYMQGGGSPIQMPFSQGAQGAPFGPGPMMQQGAPNLPGNMTRPGRPGDGNDNTLPTPRIMPTEAPYSP